MSDCDLDSSVPDWVIEHPETLVVLQELGIDTSCGGKSLGYLCRQQGLEEEAVLKRLLGCLHVNGEDTAADGEGYRFLATGEETDGKYATIEAIVPPRSGPPPHIHSREEESFFVLEGEMTFQLGEEQIVAGAGTFLNMPVGSLHCFKNEPGKHVAIQARIFSWVS